MRDRNGTSRAAREQRIGSTGATLAVTRLNAPLPLCAHCQSCVPPAGSCGALGRRPATTAPQPTPARTARAAPLPAPVPSNRAHSPTGALPCPQPAQWSRGSADRCPRVLNASGSPGRGTMAALLHGAAAVGQRLLLAAVDGAAAAAAAPAPAPLPMLEPSPVAEPSAPAPEVGATAVPTNASDGYTVRAAALPCAAAVRGGPACRQPATPVAAAAATPCRCRLARRRART